MLFNSYAFLFVFLPLVLCLYWAMPSTTARKYLSAAASYLFYGAWSAKFALLMLGTTSVDFFAARWIQKTDQPARRHLWLAVSIAINLGVLAVFKYYNFFAGALNQLLGGGLLPVLSVTLPIGISFYTFESISYVIDVYRGKVRALSRSIDYIHFVTMFPRLVAGPIVRYGDLADQLETPPRSLTTEYAVRAIHFFTLGLAKKVLVADFIAARLVNPLFGSSSSLHLTSGWAAALGYTAQIYFDFSGYSDMAVGLGYLLGFELPRNFRLPYQSASIAEFWRRWHISLSSWLRDYLYIPLGGNRQGPWRTRLNLFLTMLLGGLWHGANWTFVLWGIYHGLLLLINNSQWWQRLRLPHIASVAGTFLLVVVGWVPFRASSLHETMQVLGAMAGLHGVGLAWVKSSVVPLLILVVALAVSMTVDTYDIRLPLRQRSALVYGVLLVACVTQFSTPSPFLYFQF